MAQKMKTISITASITTKLQGLNLIKKASKPLDKKIKIDVFGAKGLAGHMYIKLYPTNLSEFKMVKPGCILADDEFIFPHPLMTNANVA